jgi:Ribonuclease G/E
MPSKGAGPEFFMTKELFVSSTPHETKVGLCEDDLLAEIYLERENEYTLAGSIYKGRVTRVLPGMQSAFVDIGLERDAFLYVSDFMELEDQDDLEDVVPTHGVATQNHGAEAGAELAQGASHARSAERQEPSREFEHGPVESQTEGQDREPSQPREDRGGMRNRRHRRGRRGERGMPESKYAKAEAPREATLRRESSGNSDYGPPPGYQPILLPGESISKYRQQVQGRAAPAPPDAPLPGNSNPNIAERFPEDEPLFVARQSSEEQDDSLDRNRGQETMADAETTAKAETAIGSNEWEREQQRLHQMNVAAVFGADEAEEIEEQGAPAESNDVVSMRQHSAYTTAPAGMMAEEEIEEEEADLDS